MTQPFTPAELDAIRAEAQDYANRCNFMIIMPSQLLRLVEQIELLTKELTNADYLRGNQLDAITSALMSDTRISHINCQLPKGHALRTPAFDDAMRTIEKIFELRAARRERARPMEWQPIIEDGKDEDVILYFPPVAGEPQITKVGRIADHVYRKPSHFMPIPKPPEAK